MTAEPISRSDIPAPISRSETSARRAGRRSPSRRVEDGRRSELIDAAARVVAREGVAAATTRRIAEEAQLPSGIVHYWFANKDELLEELASRVMGEFNAKLSLPIEQGTDPLVSLLTRLREVFSVVETDDHGRQLSTYELTAFCLRSPSLSGVARQQYDNYRAAAKSAIESWLEAHPVKLPADTSTLAAFFAAMFDGLALAWLVDPEAARPDEVFQLVAALMVGYTPPA